MLLIWDRLKKLLISLHEIDVVFNNAGYGLSDALV